MDVLDTDYFFDGTGAKRVRASIGVADFMVNFPDPDAYDHMDTEWEINPEDRIKYEEKGSPDFDSDRKFELEQAYESHVEDQVMSCAFESYYRHVLSALGRERFTELVKNIESVLPLEVPPRDGGLDPDQ